MNRLTRLFKEKKQDILNIYFTAGYPKRDDTEGVICGLAEAGADMIEIGMPYSDPLADGTTIQESGTKALQNGMSLDLLFEQIKAARTKTDVPLILMGYYNQVLQYGDSRFFEKAKSAGVDGFILPDLPLEVYEKKYQKPLSEADLKIAFLMTPQTPDDRIKKIDNLSTAFVYMVSSFAITGAKKDISSEQIAYFERVRAMKLKNPRLIGFGISDHATFSTACDYAQGAIIGSAFIKALGKENADIREVISTFVAGILKN